MEQKEAADYVCWFREIWDLSPLTTWSGAAWPVQRYWLWEDLGSEEQKELGAIGYTADIWDKPGSPVSDLEFTAWEELSPTQIDTLTWYGFYEKQWDCYIVHYSDFNWFLLERAGVTEYFMAFGWTKESWENDEDPEAWTTSRWEDLTQAQKKAANGICYFEETWNRIPISEWRDEVRTGATFYSAKQGNPDNDPIRPPQNNDDEDDGGSPGLVVLLLLLSLCGIAGCFYYKRRSKSASFDPTSPDKDGPNLNQLTMAESSSGDIMDGAHDPYTDVDLEPDDDLPTIS
jgi:hypothetical protein